MDSILLTQINEGERYRKEYGDLSGLKDSLSRVGSIHPVVLSRNPDGSFDLVAGGRRFRAFQELEIPALYHASVLDPTRLGYLFEDEVPEHRRREAEIDENIYRLNTKWQEDCLAVADLHKLKRQINNYKWGYEQTAEILGRGYGKTNVNYCVRISERLRSNDKEFLTCATMDDAVQLLTKRREEEALAELNRRNEQRIGSSPSALLDSFLDTINIGGPEKATTVTFPSLNVPSITPIGSPTITPVTERAVVPLSKMFYNEDFRKFTYRFQAGYFDHVVTDIPYAIDMDNLDQFKNIGDVAGEHEVEANVELFEPFLEESYRIVKPGGFCIFFYDLDWHEFLQATAEKVGWKVQRWPFIAGKTSACRNSAAQYNFTKNYETAMILRRDETSVLRKQQPTSVKMYDFNAERKLYNNAFAKPFELWKDLYDAISIPGQKTADLFWGEGSGSRAAANCGLIPFGCELKKNHYHRGLENMKAVYALIHKSNVEFV